jgi:hypothetical protein
LIITTALKNMHLDCKNNESMLMCLKTRGIKFVLCQSCLFWLFKLCWLGEESEKGCVSTLSTSPNALTFEAAWFTVYFIFISLSDLRDWRNAPQKHFSLVEVIFIFLSIFSGKTFILIEILKFPVIYCTYIVDILSINF